MSSLIRRRVLPAALAGTALVTGALVGVPIAAAADSGTSARAAASAAVSDPYLWAVVRSGGGLARSDGSVVSTKFLVDTLDGANYEVVFNRDVTGCVAVAAVGSTPGDILGSGRTITTVPRNGNANALVVITRDVVDGDGTTANRAPFHLQVDCV